MRKTALAAGGFALVLALTACGGDSDNGSGGGSGGDSGGLFSNAQQLFNAASEQTSETKSAKFNMTMDMAGQQITSNGEANFDGADTAMSMNMDMMGQAMEMRFVDQVMYMKMPAGAQSRTGGKPWVKITAGGTDPLSQQMGGSLDQMAQQSDPTKTLEYIKKAGTITKSEQTTLDGQQVTHYSIKLDFAKIAEQMAAGGVSAEQAKQLASKVESIPMELWLNSDQLPVKVTMDMSPLLKASGMSDQNMKMEMNYTDWGTPVTVEAPPAGQVGQFSAGN